MALRGRRIGVGGAARRPRRAAAAGTAWAGPGIAGLGGLAWPPPRTVRDAGPILGGLVLGIGAGITLERVVMTQESQRPDPEAGERFGDLRGQPTTLTSFDGTRLHLEAFGAAGPAPTLVFAHGFSLSGDAWHYQRRDLPDRFRCVFLDLRGHGRSGRAPTGDYSLTAVARDLAAVLDWTGDERIVLVAHSMSGIASLQMLETYPAVQQRLAGLVMVSSTYADNLRALATALAARSGAVPPELAHRAEDAAAEAAGQRHRPGLPVAPARAGLALLGAAAKLAGQEPRLAHNLRRRGSDFGYLGTRLFGFGSNPSPSQVTFTDQLLAATDVGVWSQVLPALLDFDSSHLLASVAVPTLVAVGDKDRLTPISAARHMVATIPDARLLVLPDSGHMAFMEEHVLLDQAIATFVDEVTGR